MQKLIKDRIPTKTKKRIASIFIVAVLFLNITIPALASVPDTYDASSGTDTIVPTTGGAAPTQHPETSSSEPPATPSTTDNGDGAADNPDNAEPEPEQNPEDASEPKATVAPLTLGINPASEILRSGAAGSQPAKIVADNHNLMLRVDGRFFGWGDNTYGQLGLGSGAPTTAYEPTEITFFADKGLKIKDIAVINDASFVLCSNGEIYSAGKGLNGRLGLGNTTNAVAWTLVPGSQSLRFEKLYGNSGQEFILATTGNNELYGWGRNNAGQVGTGTKTDVLVPTLIMSSVDIKHLETGSDFALLIKQDNSVYVWGSNSGGRYGFDTEASKSSVAVSHTACNNTASITSACTSSNHNSSFVCYTATYSSCPGLLADTEAAYLGIKGASSLTAIIDQFSSPQKVVAEVGRTFEPIASLASSWVPTGTANGVSNNTNKFKSTYTYTHNHNRNWTKFHETACVTSAPTVKSNSPVYTCTWQYVLPNAFAYFDTGKTTEIQLGIRHGMAFIDGLYYGWGDNSLKQQGTSGSDNGYMVPMTQINNYITNLNNSGDGFSRLMVAGDTNFIIFGTGNVAVWGSNANGKTGTGSGASYIDSPTQITALNGKATATIVSGRNHVLALTHTGDVHSWGDNLYGQSGLGEAYKDEIKITSPVLVETFKFSETAVVPDTPDGIDTPDEVEAGTDFEIHWTDVGADRYEIVRHFTSANIVTFGAAPLSEEVVYTGDQTTFTDTIHEEGTAYYSGRAISFLGDYSAKATSSDITVLPMSDAGNGGTDNGNNNNGNNNGGGLTNEQMLELIAKLQGNGIDEATILAIIAGMKGNGSGDIDINIPAADNKDLTAWMAELAAGKNDNSGQAGASTNIYNQQPDYSGILSAFLGESEMDADGGTNGNSDLLPIEYYVVKLMFERMFPTEQPASVAAQTTGAVVQPTYQIVQSPVPKYLCLYLIIGLLISVLGLVAVRIIPEAEEE